MRVVCWALFLGIITSSSGCIPVASSGPKVEGDAKEAGVDSPPKEKADDSIEAGRAYFDGLMQKWMAGQIDDKVKLVRPAEYLFDTPLKYEVLSVVPESPNIYGLNASVTFSSQQGTPVQKVIVYKVIWKPESNEWLVFAAI